MWISANSRISNGSICPLIYSFSFYAQLTPISVRILHLKNKYNDIIIWSSQRGIIKAVPWTNSSNGGRRRSLFSTGTFSIFGKESSVLVMSLPVHSGTWHLHHQREQAKTVRRSSTTCLVPSLSWVCRPQINVFRFRRCVVYDKRIRLSKFTFSQ